MIIHSSIIAEKYKKKINTNKKKKKEKRKKSHLIQDWIGKCSALTVFWSSSSLAFNFDCKFSSSCFNWDNSSSFLESVWDP